jgi:hypothetical protein
MFRMDFTSCPPLDKIERSNSEPSPIAFHDVSRMCEIVPDSDQETVRQGFAAIHALQIGHEVLAWLGRAAFIGTKRG